MTHRPCRAWLLPCLVAWGSCGMASATWAVQDMEEGLAAPDLQQIDDLIRDGRYETAEHAARDAIGRLEATGNSHTLEAARHADRLVEALLRGGKWKRPEALARAREATSTKQELLGPGSVETARSLQLLGQVLTGRLEFDAAREALDRSLEVMQRELGAASLEVAAVRQSIARLFIAKAEYASARPLLEQSLAVREQVLGPAHPDVAETLWLIGDCAKKQNDNETALRLLQRSQQILEETLGPRHPALSLTLNSLGETLRQSGDFAEAKALNEQAVRIVEEAMGEDSPLLVSPSAALGKILTDTGDYPAAERVLDGVLEHVTSEYGRDDPLAAGVINSLGIIRIHLGDFAGAETLLREAARIQEDIFGPWHPNLGSQLQNLAIAVAQTGRLAEAEPLFLRSLEIRIRNFGGDNQAVANSLINLASLAGELGEHSRQRDYGLRALATLDRLNDHNGYLRGVLYSVLADSSRALDDGVESLRYAGLAVTALEGAFGPLHPQVARAHAVRTRILLEEGLFPEALAAAIETETIGRNHFELTIRTATERDALIHVGNRWSAMDMLMTLAELHPEAGRPEVVGAWDNYVRARALVVNEMAMRRRDATQTTDPGIAQLREELGSATGRLAKIAVAGRVGDDAERFRQQVFAARRDRERAERALAARSEEFRSRLALSRTGYDDIRAALPRGTALVAFTWYGHIDVPRPVGRQASNLFDSVASYGAFVLPSPESDPVFVPLGERAGMSQLVERWRAALSSEMFGAGRTSKSGETTYRTAAENLRRAIWDPIAPYLGDSANVFIVPDGVLHLVNLAALPADETRYLVETLPPIHYLSTERDLLMDAPLPGDRQLLALGAPDFDGSELFAALRSKPARLKLAGGATPSAPYRGARSACGSFREMAFEPLPAASQEVVEVLDLWQQEAGDEGNAVVLTGVAASETAFKSQAAGKRVLHLATHGFFLGGQCGSALDPQEGDDVTNENPLLLSGLALAGANHRASSGPDEDDGILTAEEIATLDLRDTEWAVLSACDTGSGEIRGAEGVFGLQRAFRLAGARTTIMSLWPVEDEAARVWMTALYRNHFAEGRSTAESAHRASLELLAQRRAAGLSTHPIHWAGFIASGNWR